MKKVYAAEELRVEANFISILLPSTISLIAVQSDLEVDVHLKNSVFAFFAIYLCGVLYDLYQATLWNSRVSHVSNWIYRNLSGQSVTDDSVIGCDFLRRSYEDLETGASERKYVMPFVKILAAVLAAMLIWCLT